MKTIPNITRFFITNPNTRPALQDGRKDANMIEVRRIVCHWTANTARGADANAHRRYFQNNPDGRKASAHYFVDSRNMIQIIPDNEMALHVGERWNAPGAVAITGNRRISPNRYTIGYELCVNSDGDFKEMETRSAWLAAYLLRKHALTMNELIRHFDVTGKRCPGMYLTPETWAAYREKVRAEFDTMQGASVTAKELNVRSRPGVSFTVLRTLQQNERVVVLRPGNAANWVEIEAGEFVNSRFLQIDSSAGKEQPV